MLSVELQKDQGTRLLQIVVLIEHVNKDISICSFLFVRRNELDPLDITIRYENMNANDFTEGLGFTSETLVFVFYKIPLTTE